MGLDKFEIWVHDHVLKNEKIRHFCYGLYQRALYLVSPKMKFEGDVQVITPQDDYEYLFGYYDKCPWSEDERYILALRVKNATANADSAEPAQIVRIDLRNENSLDVLATTHCWNVQQGCMAQWLGANRILYNDFRDDSFCSVILEIGTGTERVLPMPVYALSADQKTALTLDFCRLHDLRPGYGYVNLKQAPFARENVCIWEMSLEDGTVTPLLKYRDLMGFEPRAEMEGAKHKVNHLMISPDGSRFMMLHRWIKDKTKYTRLVTCSMDGTDLFNLSDDDYVSHCCWKNDTEILSYLNKHQGGKGYYLLKDRTSEYRRCWPQLAMDGHPTYSYDGKSVVTDTYPNRKRIQSLYVMNGSRVKRVAQVFSPFKYGGNVRCDLHPRWSRDGKQICFDASFMGKRSVCLVNVHDSRTEKGVLSSSPKGKGIPRASIIIPCYNAAEYLDEALECLENQTCQDFEVICINDGSSDETLAKLMEWQKKESLEIRIIDKENAGVSSARNDGIQAARGNYILFLDADDGYHETFVQQMLDALEASGADISYCRLSRNYDAVMSADVSSVQPVSHTQEEAMHNLLYRMGEFGFCCYAYRKDLLQKTGITFRAGTKFGEDREFNWKYLSHCSRAAYVDAPLYWYRRNDKSVTGSKASWRKTDLLQAVRRIETYLEENHCDFSHRFNDYMFARAMWAVAKAFAISSDKPLFDRLRQEYDVRTCMKRTARDQNKLVRIASWLYLIHPMLFYYTVGLKK